MTRIDVQLKKAKDAPRRALVVGLLLGLFWSGPLLADDAAAPATESPIVPIPETPAGQSATEPANGQPASSSESSPKQGSNTAPSKTKKKNDHHVKLNFVAASWPQVLQRVAKQSGLTLVMKRAPGGKFTRTDRKKYPIGEAIRVLNRELEPLGYRLVRQNEFLVMLELNDLRSEYTRPVVQYREHEATKEYVCKVESLSPPPKSPEKPAIALTSDESQTTRAHAEFAEDETASRTQQSSAEKEDRTEGSARTAGSSDSPRRAVKSAQQLAEEMQIESTTVVLRRGHAVGAAKRLYNSLKHRSELIDAGPDGLPGLVVHALETVKAEPRSRAIAPRLGPIAFTVGIDVEHNRLVVEGTKTRRAAVVHVLEVLDAAQEEESAPLRLVSADTQSCLIAQNLAPELERLISQRDREGTSEPEGSSKAQGGKAAAAVPMSSDKNLSEIIKGLKGDVNVESVPELGILILRGGQSDVDAVMKVIREIERLSAGAAAQIHFYPLKNINSESFAALLNEVYKELAGQRTSEKEAKQTIRIFPVVKPNAVLILASNADMPAILKLANQLDMPVETATEFQIFRLRNGVATQVAKAVTDFFKDRKGLGTRVIAIPDPRTNSVIASAQGRDLAEVGRVIDQLDGPTAAAAVIKVFALQNGDATAIERLLGTMFATQRAGAAGATGATPDQTANGGGGELGANQALAPIRFSVDVRTNSIIAMGPPDALRAIEAIIFRLDNSDAHERQTVVIRLKNNSSDAVQRAVDTFVRSQRELAQIDPDLMSNIELLEREVFVVSEPVSNSLLLSSTPRYFTELKRMIDRLDQPPAQVIIQALIVEVELDNTDEFGIELGFQTPTIFQRSQLSNQVFQTTTISPIGQPQVSSQNIISQQANPGFQFGDPSTGLGLNPVTPAIVGTQELSNLGVGRVSNSLGFGGLVLAASSESVSALLRALSYKETIHILSRPQIRTVDNQPATIQVGQRVPIVTGASANANGALQPLVNYDNAGIILTVQPRIDADGMIVLHAYAEKSNYLTGGVTIVSDSATGRAITSPIKNVTRAETTVSLAAGNTVVMGGMITTNDDAVTRKVPWAGDLPVIGQLFRYDTRTSQRKELLIFLTPRLIRNDADDEMIKQIETERMHFIVEEAEAVHGPILSCNPPIVAEELSKPSSNVPPAPATNLPAAPGPIVPPPATNYPLVPNPGGAGPGTGPMRPPAPGLPGTVPPGVAPPGTSPPLMNSNPPPDAMPPTTRRDTGAPANANPNLVRRSKPSRATNATAVQQAAYEQEAKRNESPPEAGTAAASDSAR